MKTLQDSISEGLLDKDLVNKDIDRFELIENAMLGGFHAKGMANSFSEFYLYIIELECAKTYPERINKALEPIMDELKKNKNYPPCSYILRELESIDTKITKRFSNYRPDIPDYAERVMKMVTVAHELDSLLDKLSKKYKKGTTDDIYARLNIRNKKVMFEISTSIIGNTDKAVEAIEKFKFSGELDDVRVVYDPDGNEELDITINI